MAWYDVLPHPFIVVTSLGFQTSMKSYHIRKHGEVKGVQVFEEVENRRGNFQKIIFFIKLIFCSGLNTVDSGVTKVNFGHPQMPQFYAGF